MALPRAKLGDLSPALLVLLVLLAAAATVSSCSEARAAEEIEIDDLPAASVNEAGVWESMPWSGTDWLRLPGRATLALHHGLGRAPSAVLVYLSFTESGEGAALAAGDLARIVEVSEGVVRVRNDTEGDYYARIVLE